MAKKRIPKEKYQEICDLYQSQNIATWKIGEIFGTSERPILRILKLFNIKLKNTFEYMAKKFTEEEIKKLSDLYASGICRNQLANLFGTHKKRINKIIKELNMEIRDDTILIKKEEYPQIINLYENGFSGKEIGDMYKVNSGTILQILRKNKVKMRKRGEGSRLFGQEEELKIVKEYLDGQKSIKEIGLELGVSGCLIGNVLKRHKIDTIHPMIRDPLKLDNIKGSFKGWYKNWNFRSSNELSFIINYLEVKFPNKWEKAEKREYIIKYMNNNGKTKKYYPDFIVKGKYLIECKPKFLWSDINVLAKKKYAEIWAQNNNLKYLLIDYPIKKESIRKAYYEGYIKLSPNTEKRFLKYFNLT
jgi:hypothetical protein